MTYERWDMGSGNMLDEYETRQEAVTNVEELLGEGLPNLVQRLALFGPNSKGERVRLADGLDILNPPGKETTPVASAPKPAVQVAAMQGSQRDIE